MTQIVRHSRNLFAVSGIRHHASVYGDSPRLWRVSLDWVPGGGRCPTFKSSKKAIQYAADAIRYADSFFVAA